MGPDYRGGPRAGNEVARDELPGRYDNLAITAAHDGLATRRSIVQIGAMSNVGGPLDSSGACGA